MHKGVWEVLYAGFCLMAGMLFVLFADRQRCVRPVSVGGLACAGCLVAALGAVCHALYKMGIGHKGDVVFICMIVLGALVGVLTSRHQPQGPRV